MNKKIIQQIWLPILLVLVCLSTPFTSVYAQNIRVTIQLKDVRMKAGYDRNRKADTLSFCR